MKTGGKKKFGGIAVTAFVALLVGCSQQSARLAPKGGTSAPVRTTTGNELPVDPPATTPDQECQAILGSRASCAVLASPGVCGVCEVPGDPASGGGGVPIDPVQSNAAEPTALERIASFLVPSAHAATSAQTGPFAQHHCLRVVSESVTVCPQALAILNGNSHALAPVVPIPLTWSYRHANQVTSVGRACAYRKVGTVSGCVNVPGLRALRVQLRATGGGGGGVRQPVTVAD